MDDRSAQLQNITLGVDHGAPHEPAKAWATDFAAGTGADLRVVEVDARTTGADLVEASAADDLLVIGSFRGRRGTTVGRMPERLAERCLVPVVVVPDEPHPISGDVVLAVDEPLDQRAVAIAVAEATRRCRRLTVLRAWEMPVITRTGLTDFAEDPLRWRRINAELLERATADIARRFPEVRVHSLLVEGHPGRAIVDHTRNASLVVLGQGHIHVLSGSVLHTVIREAHAPVCIVPTPRRARPAIDAQEERDDETEGFDQDFVVDRIDYPDDVERAVS